jgi:hypothetical protein
MTPCSTAATNPPSGSAASATIAWRPPVMAATRAPLASST